MFPMKFPLKIALPGFHSFQLSTFFAEYTEYGWGDLAAFDILMECKYVLKYAITISCAIQTEKSMHPVGSI